MKKVANPEFTFEVFALNDDPKATFLVHGAIPGTEIKGSFAVTDSGLSRENIKSIRESFIAVGVKRPEAALKANQVAPYVRRELGKCIKARAEEFNISQM